AIRLHRLALRSQQTRNSASPRARSRRKTSHAPVKVNGTANHSKVIGTNPPIRRLRMADNPANGANLTEPAHKPQTKAATERTILKPTQSRQPTAMASNL